MYTNEEYILGQEDVAQAITEIYEKFRRDGTVKKTKQYVETRLSNLEKQWQDFMARHKIIKCDPNHEYITSNLYNNTQTIYEKTKKLLESRQKELEAISGGEIMKSTPPESASGLTLNQTTSSSGSVNIGTILEDQQRRYKLQFGKADILNNYIQQIDLEWQDNPSRAYVVQKIKLITSAWDTFSNTNDDIMANGTSADDDLDYHKYNFFGSTNNMVQNILIKLQERLETPREHIQDTSSFGMRLPQVEIPKFFGQYEKWASFYEIFKKLIHENNNISKTMKMHYLKTKLGGQAAQLINHLQMLEDNYDGAWTIVTSRYNNKRLLVSTYIDAILSQKTTTGESADAIRSLHDTTREALHGLNNLGFDTSSWNPIIIHVLLQKIDKETHRLYEVSLKNPKEIPTTEEFLNFLEQRFQSLHAIEKNTSQGKFKNISKDSNTKKVNSYHADIIQDSCGICKKNHKLENCQTFKQYDVQKRLQCIIKEDICRLCLKSTHTYKLCKDTNRCLICKGKHHYLLHTNGRYEKGEDLKNKKGEHSKNEKSEDSKGEKGERPSTTQETRKTAAHVAKLQQEQYKYNTILLPTALVRATLANGSTTLLRALIDQGSQGSFITESSAQLLALPRQKVQASISGIGSSENMATSCMEVEIRARYPSTFKINVTALVLKQLTQLLPETTIKNYSWKPDENMILADPTFDISGPIDLILGSDIYAHILLNGIKQCTKVRPMAQRTELGWIISGGIHSKTPERVVSVVSQVNIDKQLKQFWELNENDQKRTDTIEERECEEIYQKTHHRESCGKYVVKLPFKPISQHPDLGPSRDMAVATLLQLEKKFQKEPLFYEQYKNFIAEYIQLGHMKRVRFKPYDESNNKPNYLPHHAVVKESSTTKLRVVFDAARKTKNKKSLNDNLRCGPQLQENMTAIILRWRKHMVAFTADIQAMYRQILVDENDKDYQRIVWRNSPTEQITDYQLQTLTYGTSSAPYLAIKTLQQLAQDETRYPIGSQTVMKDFYVDDCISGANTMREALDKQSEVRKLLQSGGFHIRKWASNKEEILKRVPREDREMDIPLKIDIDSNLKTLGIVWNPTTDNFGFTIKISTTKPATTKRTLLSEVSSLFDPLGWLAPIIIKAKILLQELWTSGTAWDDDLPSHIQQQWSKIKEELSHVENMKISRWLCYNTEDRVELHGFADASEKAYAAVIYSRIIKNNGEIIITLLNSKTKVAPLKQVSLPRLELCACQLLAILMKTSIDSLDISNIKPIMWTDSEITLAWIKGNPSRWKTFVANRVTEIQQLTNPSDWHHVKSSENPADIASRGMNPKELLQFTLWWNGPIWLKKEEISITPITIQEPIVEVKSVKAFTISRQQPQIKPYVDLLGQFSTFTKLTRVVAYCLRFKNNAAKSERVYGPLSAEEINKATARIIKIAQEMDFPAEIKCLKNGQNLATASKIIALNPLICDEIIRVGGRLQNSDLSYRSKHPIIIAGKNPIAKLLIEQAHKKTMHGGINITSATLRQEYWIVNAYKLIKKVVKNCLVCYRYNSNSLTQLMGNLPKPRTTITRAFTHTGIDYAGPIKLKIGNKRNNTAINGYIAIFICLATKAIHIETVSDLTAKAFIAAFKRFTGRRGNVGHIYSDNGTNFVLANKILQFATQLEADEYNNEICNAFATNNIRWHFIPPASPHFGGLWEAGVKSIKYHLKRTIGENKLTFEELNTVLIQIEACLNSRPLCPLTSNIEDTDYLSPGHFLIGTSLLAPPDENVLDLNSNRLNRWQLLQKMYQQFWKKWSEEYLTRLQERPKWQKTATNIKIGDLVLLKDQNLPPSRWALGRIIDQNIGSDKLSRVVTIKTKNSELIRPITKICLLPSNDDKIEFEQKAVQTYTTSSSTIIHRRKKIHPVNMKKYTTVHPDDPEPIKKRKLSLKLLMPFALVLCCMHLPSIDSSFIQPFNTEPGIYFDGLGRINLAKTDWNIIIYFNLTTYWNELDKYKSHIDLMKQICIKKDLQISQEWCNIIVNQFLTQMNQIRRGNEMIYERNGYSQIRFKRSPFDVVGTIANELFGVLDQRAAKHFENEINKVSNNEEYLLELIKNQTSIEESTMNILKETQVEIDTRLQQQWTVLDNNINNLELTQKATNLFFVVSTHLSQLLQKYQQIQNNLIDMIVDTHHGKIHPAILSPAQLKSQLSIIREHLPHSLRLPGDSGSGNLIQYYKLFKAQVRVTEQKIILRLKLPITNTEYFQLFQLIAVPIPHLNKYVTILPSSIYLAANLERTQFYALDEIEFQACIVLDNTEYLCKQRTPLYTSNNNKHRCEINILTHNNTIDEKCVIGTSEFTPIWIQLKHQNTWIYALHEEYTLDLICGTSIQTSKLQGSGLLHMNASCTLKHNGLIIGAHNNYISNFNTAIISVSNVSIDSLKELSSKNIDTGKPQLQEFNPQPLAKLKEDILRQKQKEQLPTKPTAHDIHQYVVLYTLICILIVAGIYLIKVRLTKKRLPKTTIV